MDIEFPDDETWDDELDLVRFTAQAGGEDIPCAISWEALLDHYGADTVKPLDAYRAHRGTIQEIARRLIRRSDRHPDRVVVIRSRDC
jgi:hypothetical protein